MHSACGDFLYMNKEKAREAVSGTMDRINGSWLEGRLGDLPPLFDEDIVMALPGGETRIAGRTIIVASFEQFVRNARILEFRETDRQIDILGDIAVVSFGYVLVYEREDEGYRATGRDLWIFRATVRAGEDDDPSYRAIFRTMFDLAEEPTS
jgi:Domain of unknown function (DUF4440)